MPKHDKTRYFLLEISRLLKPYKNVKFTIHKEAINSKT